MGKFMAFMEKQKRSAEINMFLDGMKDKDDVTKEAELGKKFNLSGEEIKSSIQAWQEDK